MMDMYVSLLSSFFSLSELSVSPSTPSTLSGPSTWIPQGSNSITTGTYLTKLLGILSDYASDMSSSFAEISQGQNESGGLKALLDSVRWRFLDVLSDSWKNGILY